MHFKTSDEWKAISWSSWTSSSWSTWARSVWGNVNNAQNRQRIAETSVTGAAADKGAQGGPQHLLVNVNASGNNNNVINAGGEGPAQPGQINITVHTGNYKESSGNLANAQANTNALLQPSGSGGLGDGRSTGDGSAGGNRGRADGRGHDSGDADSDRLRKKSDRHGKGGRDGDGEDGGSSDGDGGRTGKGRGRGRGKGRGKGKGYNGIADIEGGNDSDYIDDSGDAENKV
ncbi:unnamed protein product, partial [Strongylus vulgaris]